MAGEYPSLVSVKEKLTTIAHLFVTEEGFWKLLHLIETSFVAQV